MITIGLADKNSVFMYRMQDFFSRQDGISIIKTAYNGDDFLRGFTKDNLPDVALVNIDLPLEPGIAMAGYFRTFGYKTRFILLADHYSRERAREAIEAGALGIIDEDTPAPIFLKAVQAVHNNRMFIYISEGPWLQKIIGNAFGVNLLNMFGIFRKREADPARMLLRRGFSNKEIHSVLYKLFRNEAEIKKRDNNP